MNISEIIRRLVKAGATPPVIAIAVEAIERTNTDSSGQFADNQADVRRKRERFRKREIRRIDRQNKEVAEANDAAKTSRRKADNHADTLQITADKRCDLTSFPSLLSESVTNEGRKDRGVTRARGSWLPVDAKLSDEDRKAAIGLGLSDPDLAWAEFVDYWIGVPGQRGRKVDWPATWRNRVRELVSRKGKSNGRGHRTELQSALDKLREFSGGGDPGESPVAEVEPESSR